MKNRVYRRSLVKQQKNKIILLVMVLVAAAVLGLILYSKLHSTYKVIPTTSPSKTVSSKDEPSVGSTQDKSQASSTPTPVISSKQDEIISTSGSNLKTPSGTFVSNHSPSISNKDVSSSEQSICNTTPGASCEIRLTKDNDTKVLASQLADNNGNVYWSWDVKSAGLSTGKWTITVEAKLGDTTLTATDQLSLDVKP